MIGASKSQIHPLLGILISVFIIVFGLVTAKDIRVFYFLAGVYLLLLVTGFHRACLRVLPVTGVLAAIFALLSYAISRNLDSSLAMGARLLALGVAVIPGMCVIPSDLTRSLTKLRVPRSLTLGMLIAWNFVPLLKREVGQIREAMRTRGAGSMLNPKIAYRAFMIPLIMRLVNISDTLSLSVETRGFQMGKAEVSIYKDVRVGCKDILLTLLILGGAIMTVVL